MHELKGFHHINKHFENLNVFFSGCCLGRSRAVRPSVSEAKVKTDATAIISRLQCKFSKNKQRESQSHKPMRRGEATDKAKKGKSRTNEEEGHWVKTLGGLWENPLIGKMWKGRGRGGTTVLVHIYGHGNHKRIKRWETYSPN